ncbi:MAG: DUF4432 family protein [Acidimicrobiia bacterium]
MSETPAAAWDDGLLANIDAILHVRSSVVVDGPSSGMRAIDIRVDGGIHLRLLPDRGLDIGGAWALGRSLAWVSGVGERPPIPAPSEFEWGDAFGGGLMVTCGLRNVGMPSEGHGLHGTYSHQRASVESTRRHLSAREAYVEVAATVEDASATGHHFMLRRTIRTHARRHRVEIEDTTTNLGRSAEPAPVLYHFNFGYPLWSGGARLELQTSRTIPRDPASEASLGSWDRPPAVEDTEEKVLEHEMLAYDGWCSARLVNEELGLAVRLGWRTAELPRLHQWIHPAPGVYSLGIEPANCSTSGRAHDRAEDRLPVLEPGQSRETALRVDVDLL